jgi:3,4-dihydroxy 2-butanone 4-phosphate synthase/GTP cyclohydrolase II
MKSNKEKFLAIEQALEDLRQGKMIVLVDDEQRENEGDLVIAAELATPNDINFMCHEACGLICVSLTKSNFERLGIPMMAEKNSSLRKTAFGVAIDAAEGVTTGISAADRARVIRIVADPNSKPLELAMPGHVFPLCAEDQGVMKRAGHTEGSVDLMRLAGLEPAAVVCEIMNADGTMARLPDLKIFAEKHQLKIISIEDLISYRLQREYFIEQISSAHLPLRQLGKFQIHTFRNLITQSEEVAIVREPVTADKPCLVRLHSECLTGDVFGSDRCDCGLQLENSLEQIAKEGGILLYLRQEGRGIGLGNKIKAYNLQDQGLDTVEANHHLGFASDQREYGIAAQILRMLKVQQIRLLTNNPDKISKMAQYGIEILERVPLITHPTPDNIRYLTAKRDKLGHLLKVETGDNENSNSSKSI